MTVKCDYWRMLCNFGICSVAVGAERDVAFDAQEIAGLAGGGPATQRSEASPSRQAAG